MDLVSHFLKKYCRNLVRKTLQRIITLLHVFAFFVFSHPFYSFAKAKEIAKYEEENGITPAEKIASWPSNGLSDIRNEAL